MDDVFPSGLASIGDKTYCAVFPIFDITNGKFSLRAVFDKTPLATLLWGVGGFIDTEVGKSRISHNSDTEFHRLSGIGLQINITHGGKRVGLETIVL